MYKLHVVTLYSHDHFQFQIILRKLFIHWTPKIAYRKSQRIHFNQIPKSLNVIESFCTDKLSTREILSLLFPQFQR